MGFDVVVDVVIDDVLNVMNLNFSYFFFYLNIDQKIRFTRLKSYVREILCNDYL